MRFAEHVNRCLQRAYINLKLIYQNRSVLNRRVKSMLCEQLVLSQVNYGDAIYGPCLRGSEVRRIQKLQNSCLRLIFGIRKYSRISYTLKLNNWLHMHNRRYLHAATLFFTIIKTKTPAYLSDRLTYRTDVHNLNTRFKGTLSPPLHATQFFERSFSYQIVKTYNNLSPILKNLHNKTLFRKRLSASLFSEQSQS